MRRGQTTKPSPKPNSSRRGGPPVMFSKRELLEACELSPKTFDTIRKAARVRGPGHGGMDWAFSADDVRALIYKASGGTFTERGRPAAAAWRGMLEERGFEVEVDDGGKRRG